MPWWLTLGLTAVGKLFSVITESAADTKRKEGEIVQRIVGVLKDTVHAFELADARIAANDADVDAAIADAKRVILEGRPDAPTP